MTFPTASSTPDDAKAEYARCVNYESDPTGALAQSFLVVCRWMQAQRPEQSTTSMQANAKFESVFESLQKQIDAVQRWLANLNMSAAGEIARLEAGGSSLPRQFGLSNIRNGW